MDIDKVAERLQPYEGKEAILRDRPLIARVCMEEIDVSEWGLRVTVFHVPTPGLWMPPKPRWTVSGAWMAMHVGERRWGASYSGWSLYVDPEAVSAVVGAAAKFVTDIDDLWEWADNKEKYDVLVRRYANLAPLLNQYG